MKNKDIELNNGSIARYIGEDHFSRPRFEIPVEDKWIPVVSIEFDFDKLDLHSITRDGEPNMRLTKPFQPRK
jgi:hypothetical protein